MSECLSALDPADPLMDAGLNTTSTKISEACFSTVYVGLPWKISCAHILYFVRCTRKYDTVELESVSHVRRELSRYSSS